MNNPIARAQGDPTSGHDEIGQSVLRLDIDWLGVCRGMTERLHGQICGESEAGEILQLIPRHGSCGVLRSNSRHTWFAISAGANTFDSARASHHFLCQREAFVRGFGLVRFAKQGAFLKTQRLSRFCREPATDNEIDASASSDLVEQNLRAELEFRHNLTGLRQDHAIVRFDLDDIAHLQLLHRRLEY